MKQAREQRVLSYQNAKVLARVDEPGTYIVAISNKK